VNEVSHVPPGGLPAQVPPVGLDTENFDLAESSRWRSEWNGTRTWALDWKWKWPPSIRITFRFLVDRHRDDERESIWRPSGKCVIDRRLSLNSNHGVTRQRKANFTRWLLHIDAPLRRVAASSSVSSAKYSLSTVTKSPLNVHIGSLRHAAKNRTCTRLNLSKCKVKLIFNISKCEPYLTSMST